jgi:hypothetical protein
MLRQEDLRQNMLPRATGIICFYKTNVQVLVEGEATIHA